MTKEKETRDRLDELLTGQIGQWRDHWLDTLPPVTQPHAFSPGFRRRMERLLCRAEAYPCGRPRLRLALLLAALLAAMVMMLTAGAQAFPTVRRFRSGIIDIFSQTFPKYTDVVFSTDHIGDEPIKRPVFGWLPDDLTETERNQLDNATSVGFENKDGDRLSVFVARITDSSSGGLTLDTEDAEIRTVTIGADDQAVMILKKNRTILTWTMDNYICTLVSRLPTDDTVKIAENITLISEEIIPSITVQTPEGYTETEHEEYILSSVYSFAKEDSAFRLEVKKVFPTSQNTMKVDTEDAEVTYITIHGQEAMLVREDGWVILIWAEGNYFLSISGEMDASAAIEFADSIRIEE